MFSWRSLGFTAGYVLVLGYFNFIDVYHNHFFDKHYAVIYNVMRLVFTFYFFWMTQLPGRLLLERLGMLLGILPLDSLIVSFFVGASIWTLLLLFVSYAHLLYWIVEVALTLPAVALAYPHFVDFIEYARRNITAGVLNRPTIDVNLISFCVTLVLISAFLLLSLKGLYLAGGHDYYNHYFPYYEKVIISHSIWPNDVWYHYYYDKADGLFFLAMLLSDPLQTSLVSYCFALAVGGALFVLLRDVKPDTLWPFVCVVLYFTLYSNTLGTDVYKANGGWGDFQKPHEVCGAFIFGTVWMSARLVAADENDRTSWLAASALCAVASVFILAVSAGILGLFAVIGAGLFLAARKPREAKAFIGLALVVGGALSLVLAINFLTTGLPLDAGINFFWPIVDLAHLNALGYLYNVAWAHLARGELWKAPLFSSYSNGEIFFANVFRAELLLPLFVSSISAAILAFKAVRRGLVRSVSIMLVYLAFLAAVIVFATVPGASEKVSFVRVATFMLPMSIAGCGLILQMGSQYLGDFVRWRAVARYVVPVAVAGATLLYAGANFASSFSAALASSARFDIGKYSLYDSFKDQTAFAGRMPWGAIYPASEAVWRIVEPGARIWSLHVHSYCMLPGCNIEERYSFIMSPQADEIYFGPPENAKKILQTEGLNYFLFSQQLSLRDDLVCAPLFSPENIGRYLGLKWTDGTTSLLTWLGPGVAPLSADWITRYWDRVKSSPLRWGHCDHSLSLTVGHSVTQQVTEQHRNWGYEVDLP